MDLSLWQEAASQNNLYFRKFGFRFRGLLFHLDPVLVFLDGLLGQVLQDFGRKRTLVLIQGFRHKPVIVIRVFPCVRREERAKLRNHFRFEQRSLGQEPVKIDEGNLEMNAAVLHGIEAAFHAQIHKRVRVLGKLRSNAIDARGQISSEHHGESLWTVVGIDFHEQAVVHDHARFKSSFKEYEAA